MAGIRCPLALCVQGFHIVPLLILPIPKPSLLPLVSHLGQSPPESSSPTKHFLVGGFKRWTPLGQ